MTPGGPLSLSTDPQFDVLAETDANIMALTQVGQSLCRKQCLPIELQ
jgi:hypothetical protein